MPVIPDLPWNAEKVGEEPGIVEVTFLHLRRLRDVPEFLRDSMAVRKQVMASPGARCVHMRAQPLARRFHTVTWWDDEAALRAFVRTDPHRTAIRRWASEMVEFYSRPYPGSGTPPTVPEALARVA